MLWMSKKCINEKEINLLKMKINRKKQKVANRPAKEEAKIKLTLNQRQVRIAISLSGGQKVDI